MRKLVVWATLTRNSTSLVPSSSGTAAASRAVRTASRFPSLARTLADAERFVIVLSQSLPGACQPDEGTDARRARRRARMLWPEGRACRRALPAEPIGEPTRDAHAPETGLTGDPADLRESGDARQSPIVAHAQLRPTECVVLVDDEERASSSDTSPYITRSTSISTVAPSRLSGKISGGQVWH